MGTNRHAGIQIKYLRIKMSFIGISCATMTKIVDIIIPFSFPFAAGFIGKR